eukprot:5894492-Lingulodinium_polyedra.AAC.1
MMKAERQRLEDGIELRGQAYKEWRAQKRADFAALPEQVLEVERAEARAAHAAKVAAAADSVEDKPSLLGQGAITTTVVDAIGNDETPYPPSVFAAR